MKFAILTLILACGAALADHCTQLCTLIPGLCSSKGSYCKDGRFCMDLFWLTDSVICNHTSMGCRGKRGVSCAEANRIVAANNVPEIRASASLEMTGTLLGASIKALVQSRRFTEALALGPDRRTSAPSLNVFMTMSHYTEDASSWENVHQLTLAIERTPAALAFRYSRTTFENWESGVHALFESLIDASTAMESVLSASLGSRERVFVFTAYTGLGTRTFEESLYIGGHDFSGPLLPRRMATVVSLPSLLFVRIVEYSDRAGSFERLPLEFDFNDVAHVEPGAGPTRYRLLNTIGYSLWPTGSDSARATQSMYCYSLGPRVTVSPFWIAGVVYERVSATTGL